MLDVIATPLSLCRAFVTSIARPIIRPRQQAGTNSASQGALLYKHLQIPLPDSLCSYLNETANRADLLEMLAIERPDAVNASFAQVLLNGGTNSQENGVNGSGTLEAALDIQFGMLYSLRCVYAQLIICQALALLILLLSPSTRLVEARHSLTI